MKFHEIWNRLYAICDRWRLIIFNYLYLAEWVDFMRRICDKFIPHANLRIRNLAASNIFVSEIRKYVLCCLKMAERKLMKFAVVVVPLLTDKDSLSLTSYAP